MSPHRLGNEISARTSSEVSAGAAQRRLAGQTLERLGPKWDVHLPVFLSAPALARLLWLDSVYRVALPVPGCLVEFGCQWGASLNTFLLLKLIHEPWNAGRRILGFSTFSQGFTTTSAQDGAAVKAGDYGVEEDWEQTLNSMLEVHAGRSPLGSGANHEVIAGDVRETFPRYLDAHPELVLSHVHFDLDVYAPTREMLRLCLPRMPRGAVLVFDELNCPAFPGETTAMAEVLGISGLALKKTPYQPYSAYAIIGD